MNMSSRLESTYLTYFQWSIFNTLIIFKLNFPNPKTVMVELNTEQLTCSSQYKNSYLAYLIAASISNSIFCTAGFLLLKTYSSKSIL